MVIICCLSPMSSLFFLFLFIVNVGKKYVKRGEHFCYPYTTSTKNKRCLPEKLFVGTWLEKEPKKSGRVPRERKGNFVGVYPS